jgi:hypothetical protein
MLVQGKVYGKDGKPLAFANVFTSYVSGAPAAPNAGTTTDDNGAFKLETGVYPVYCCQYILDSIGCGFLVDVF